MIAKADVRKYCLILTYARKILKKSPPKAIFLAQGLFGWEEYDWNYYITTATPSLAANVGVELLMFYLGIGIEFMPCFSPNNFYYRYYDSQASRAFRNFLFLCILHGEHIFVLPKLSNLISGAT